MYRKIFAVFLLCFILISGQCSNTENHTSVITAEEIQSEITIEKITEELSSEPETENEEQIIIGGHSYPASIRNNAFFAPKYDSENLNGIEQLTNVKHVAIYSYSYISVNDISAVSKLSSLEMLTIENGIGVFRIADIAGASNLESLSLSGYDSIDFEGIEQFTQMEIITIEGNAEFKNIAALGKLTSLATLGIFYRNRVFRIADIGKSNIKSLWFTDCGGIDLAGITQFSEISTIAIDMSIPVNYENLQELAALEYLSFSVPHENMDLDFLQKIQSLEELHLTAIDPNTRKASADYYELDVAFLSSLKNLKHIRFFRFSIKNFNTLSELPKLAYITIRGNENSFTDHTEYIGNVDYSLFPNTWIDTQDYPR